MTARQRLVIIGGGGLGAEVAWAAANMDRRAPAFEILGYSEESSFATVPVGGYPMLGAPEDVAGRFGSELVFVCAVGINQERRRLVALALALGWTPVSVIDPSVMVAPEARVGVGVYVGLGSSLSPACEVGDHAIVNQHCTIGHHSRVGAFAQVCPGGRISGHATLGEGAFVGSNAVVGPRISMGRGAVLGACSFAAGDIPADVTAVGVPARVVLRHVEVW